MPPHHSKLLHIRLWRVLGNKEEYKSNLPTIGVDNRLLEAIKRRNCLTNCKLGNIPVHVHSEKQRKDISEYIPDGGIAKESRTIEA